MSDPTNAEQRPWAQMSSLERTLRSHLYTPTDLKKRAEADLPKHVRRKEYREAAQCQDSIRRADRDIAMWQHLIDLYLQETQAPKAPPNL